MNIYKKIIIVIVVIVILPSLIFQIILPMMNISRVFSIPSSSMNPTILKNDKVLVSMNVDDLKTDDIVAYDISNKKIGGNTKQLKRIVAVSGDRISRNGNTLLINGMELCELVNYQDSYDLKNWVNILNGEYILPEGMYFIIGDNINNSLDSRTYGPIAQKDIVGKFKFKMGILGYFLFL